MTVRPTLVLISGAPGTGNTELAQRLAEGVPVAVIEKDAIKESLFGTLGEGSRNWSRKLGAASFELLRMLIQSHLNAGQSIVAEAAFQPEFDVPWPDRFKQRFNFRILELHCYTDRNTAINRYRRREVENERHSGHRSGMSVDAHITELRDRHETYGPLTSGEGLVRIDTTDFATVDYVAILERIRALLGHYASH